MEEEEEEEEGWQLLWLSLLMSSFIVSTETVN